MKESIAFAQALGDETRFRVLHLILEQWMCVCELADVLKLPQSTLSSHLQVIQKAGLLKSEKKGKWMFYRVGKSVRPLLTAVYDHFEISAATNKTLAGDAAKAAKQVSTREMKCCPAPNEKAPSSAKKSPKKKAKA